MPVFEYRLTIFKPTNSPLTIMAIWDPCQISACERRQRAVKFKEEVEVCCLVSELKRILIIWFPFPHPLFTQITHKCAHTHKASQLKAAKVWDFEQMCPLRRNSIQTEQKTLQKHKIDNVSFYLTSLVVCFYTLLYFKWLIVPFGFLFIICMSLHRLVVWESLSSYVI